MAFLKNISLQQLWQGAVATFLQYPLALLSALLGTVAALIRIEIPYNKEHLYTYLDKLMLVGALGLVLFFVLELLVQKYGLDLKRRAMLWLAGSVFLVVYYLLLPRAVEERTFLRFLLLVLALHLAAAYAMFVNRREENAFWQFNKSLFLRFLTALLYTTVLYIGLTIAVAAIHLLFSVEVAGEFYAELWVSMVGIFNTWFFLAGVPTRVSELEQSDQYPRGLKVFTQFVLLPLVALYLVILYLYFGKIVLQWEWPKGWVSVLVLCFSIAGVLSLLLIYPIRREPGNTWMRTFARWFYRALFPLIILLLLAIWRRVSEYGLTEPRYVVLALALWLCCVALYFLLSRLKNIKFIPVTLSIVALLMAYGPFNAFQVSAWSQTNRLEELLQGSGVLHNGQVQEKHPKVKEDVAREVSAIVRYLAEKHDLHELQPWFKQDLDSMLASKTDPATWSSRARADEQARLLVERMGIAYSERYVSVDTDEVLYFSVVPEGDGATVVDLAGYTYGMRFNPAGAENQSQSEYLLGKQPLTVKLEHDKQQLYFEMPGETLTLHLLPIIKQLEKKQGRPLSQAEMTFTVEGSKMGIKLLVQDLYVAKKDDYRIGNLSGYLYVKRKE
ncbi:DUF4153 domain-containing protein [Pontibacter liquoris]|uniref:DUF4153 domain-containing protein n=1 Tax=Pontibacter liquoris TaxID=2905677 RepID=UPI001FA6DDDF|nr:DUF4153 domain-containing protein [Pontibacter liquoris]